MLQIKFEDLPQAVGQLIEKIDRLEKSLNELNLNLNPDQSTDLLDIKQAASLLNLAVPTVYAKVSKNEIPYMKQSKRLYFSKSELLQYIQSGHAETIADIKNSALNCIIKPRRA
jgi:excisionase family DNA binding protein